MATYDRVVLDNGRIVLILGDCIEIIPKVNAPVRLVVADQPYFRATDQEWDHQWASASEHLDWSKQWLSLARAKMTSDASLYFWYGIGRKHQLFFNLGTYLSEAFCFQDLITWQKSRGLGNRKGWLYTREELLWVTKTPEYIWNEAYQYDLTQPTNRTDLGFDGRPRKSQFKRYTNIWPNNDDQNYGADRIRSHYTPKPAKLIERIVLAHTLSPADVVLDPFLGSGTTAVVCALHRRCCIGIEKDPASFYAAVDRVKATLAEVS
jgi:site-specific DNA-methyltransferase (adenine-specific)